jgi:hypothetical protein
LFLYYVVTHTNIFLYKMRTWKDFCLALPCPALCRIQTSPWVFSWWICALCKSTRFKIT